MALTTLALLGTYLGTDLTANAAAQQAVDAACDLAETHCGRTFASASYTYWTRMRGEAALALPEYPVSALTSVSTALTNGGTATLLVSGDDYSLQDSNAGIVWFSGPVEGWVKVVYTAGYAAIPDDLEQAATELAAAIYQGSSRTVGVIEERLGDYSYKLADASADATKTALCKLNPWKKARL